jgi:L-threonylcarbamoyladenylate synthase
MGSTTDSQPRATPAVFLDRDGTLIEDRGDLGIPEQVIFYPETLPALGELSQRFALVIVTHQPAIGAGRLTPQAVARVNQHVVDELARAGIPIRGLYTCPHQRSDHCACIKPEPMLVEQAARQHGLDLGRSYVVGDHPHDMQLAGRVAATGVYVLSGHGVKHLSGLPPGHIVATGIGAAVRAILEDSRTDQEDRVGLAARTLRRGGLVAFPTETVYGLGASALDPSAASRVFEVKRRPTFDPLIVHVADYRSVEDLVTEVPEGAGRLLECFWPGPLTVVLKKRDLVPDIVTAGLPTVALRMPDHPIALNLLRRAAVPVCAPSANPFGYVSPTTAAHVSEQLGHLVDVLVDGGPCRVGVESTIISFAADEPLLLRHGGTPLEAIETELARSVTVAAAGERVCAPGLLSRHYSPKVRLETFAGEVPSPASGRTGLMLMAPRSVPAGYALVEILSQRGDLGEVARNLFAALRRIDEAQLDLAFAELAPALGLGAAINDRLRRAASRDNGRKPTGP